MTAAREIDGDPSACGAAAGPTWGRADSACIAALVAGVLLATWPMLEVWHGEAPGEQGPGGAVYVHYHLLYAARTAILAHGQFPFRSPWHGGYPTIGFPYDSTLSPRLLLALAFGEVPAVKLDFLLMYAALAVGMYLVGRQVVGLGTLGSTAAAAAAAFSGFLPGMMLVGMATRARWCLVPLILVLVADRRRPRVSLLAGAVVYALTIADGGLTMISAGVLLVFVALLQLHPAGHQPGPLDRRFATRSVAILAWGALIGLPKLVMGQYAVGPYSTREPFPISWWSTAFWAGVAVWLWGCGARRWAGRRLGPHGGTVWTAALVATALVLMVGATLITRAAGPGYADDELRGLRNQWDLMMRFRSVGDYDLERGEWRTQTWLTVGVGPVWLALAAFGALAFWQRLGRWTILLALALVDQIGHSLPFDLVVVSARVPFLHLLDPQTEREFLQPIVLLGLAVLAGGAVDGLARVLRRRRLGLVLWAVVAGNTLWLIPHHWTGIREGYRYRAPVHPSAVDLYTVRLENDRPDLPWCYSWARRNVAALPWDMRVKDPRWKALVPRFFALDDRIERPNPRYPGAEVWTTAGDTQAVRFAPGGFTPNRITLEVALERPANVVINQPYDPLWRVAGGDEVVDHNGLLAVLVGRAGARRITLRYVPARFYAAALAGLASLVVVPIWWWRAGRSRETPAPRARPCTKETGIDRV